MNRATVPHAAARLPSRPAWVRPSWTPAGRGLPGPWPRAPWPRWPRLVPPWPYRRGPWMPAVLEREADPLGWRRWRLDLQLPAGLHTLAVRAVDGTGQGQAAQRVPPHPSGASGSHRIVVRVRPS